MNTSDIKKISFDEGNGVSGHGTLPDQILALTSSGIVFSDIFVHQDSPLIIRQPSSMVIASQLEISKEEIEDFFEKLNPNWKAQIAERAFDVATNLSNARLRANCFSYEGRTKIGAVIRKFPTEPLPLDSLGLRDDSIAFAHSDQGLFLIVGDTCQGKSTTIASMLDEINKNRSGHIVTNEDPVETLIPQRKCIITQREVGLNGDVQSYYLGALDALRQRPTVFMVGEIREEEVARETVAIQEAGPIVFATLHSQTPEQAISKMIRLLGNTDSAAQTLSQSLKGILCQALLPSTNGDRYYLVTECLTVNAEIAKLIESRNYVGIRAALETAPNCHTMNGDMLPLYREGKISYLDAKRASTDRGKFNVQFKPK